MYCKRAWVVQGDYRRNQILVKSGITYKINHTVIIHLLIAWNGNPSERPTGKSLIGCRNYLQIDASTVKEGESCTDKDGQLHEELDLRRVTNTFFYAFWLFIFFSCIALSAIKSFTWYLELMLYATHHTILPCLLSKADYILSWARWLSIPYNFGKITPLLSLLTINLHSERVKYQCSLIIPNRRLYSQSLMHLVQLPELISTKHETDASRSAST